MDPRESQGDIAGSSDVPDGGGHAGVPSGADPESARIYRQIWDSSFTIAIERTDDLTAGEIAQRVALAFWRKWRDGQVERFDEQSITGWTVVATRLELLARSRAVARRQRREVPHELAGPESQVHVYSPAEHYHATELESIVTRVLRAMPARQRDVFLAVRERGQSYEAIASTKNITQVTARRHYSMAFERLRMAVDRYMTDGTAPEHIQ